MDNNDIIIVILIILAVFLYFLPSYIGFKRNNPFKWIVFIVNLLFGWTFIVWVVLLIYTAFPNKKTILDPIIDPSGSMSAKEYGNRFNDLKTHSNKINTIKELYQLKESGAISEQEFNIYRNKLKL